MLDMWIGGSVPGMEPAGLSATRREPVPGGSNAALPRPASRPVPGLTFSLVLALASLAYTRRDYTTATSLYDQAIERFPTLLLEKSSAVFQLAELYFRSRRLAEAKPFYQDFLSRFPGADPE